MHAWIVQEAYQRQSSLSFPERTASGRSLISDVETEHSPAGHGIHHRLASMQPSLERIQERPSVDGVAEDDDIGERWSAGIPWATEI